MEEKIRTIGDPKQANTSSENHEKTAIIGGLKSFSDLKQVEDWIREILWTHWIQQSTEVYAKGEFEDIAFIRFESQEARDAAIKILRDPKNTKPDVWAKEDLPITTRARRALLLGIRWHLK